MNGGAGEGGIAEITGNEEVAKVMQAAEGLESTEADGGCTFTGTLMARCQASS